MKKRKYIVPACIVLEMEAQEELMALSQGEIGSDTGAEPDKGDSSYDFDAVGGWGKDYDVWDE